MFRKLLALGAPLLPLAQIVSAAEKPTDVELMHQTQQMHVAITASNLDRTFKAANEQYELMSRREASPTVELFSQLTALTEHYDNEWQRSSATLNDDEKILAIDLADRLYGGALGGYHNNFKPLADANEPNFHDKRRINNSKRLNAAAENESIRDAAQDYLQMHLATLTAWNTLQGLSTYGEAILGNPSTSKQFSESYKHYTPYGEQFGLMSEFFGLVKGKYKYKFIEMIAERARGDRPGQVVENPASAQGYLLTADMALSLAHERFTAGNMFGIEKIAYDASKQAADARSFGALRRSVRSMLLEYEEELTAKETRTTTDKHETTFGALIFSALDEHQDEEEHKHSVDMLDYTEPVGEPFPEMKGMLEEHVVVPSSTAVNYPLFLYTEQELLLREAIGEDMLTANLGLMRTGKQLFQGMLRERLNPKQYNRLSDSFAQAMTVQGKSLAVPYAGECFALPLPAEDGLAESLLAEGRVKEDRASRMTAFGSRLFTIPAVQKELDEHRYGDRIRQELRVVDSAEHHIDLADGFNRAARPGTLAETITAMDLRMNALYEYLQAIGRYADLTGAPSIKSDFGSVAIVTHRSAEASSTLHLATGQTAYNFYALMARAQVLAKSAGLNDQESFIESLGGDADAEGMTRRYVSYRKAVSDVLDLSRAAFLEVTEQGYSTEGPPEMQNARYRNYLEGLAGIVRADNARGQLAPDEKRREQIFAEMRSSLQAIAATEPANGQQAFARGIIFADRLKLPEQAMPDLCRAYRLLPENRLGERAQEKVGELGYECSKVE